MLKQLDLTSDSKHYQSLESISVEPENRITVRRTYAKVENNVFSVNISEVPQIARKYLYKTVDNKVLETGLYQQPVTSWHGRPSIEISTQIGCAMRCIMCASGETKFVRNLTELELILQILMTKKLAGITQDNIAVSAMGTGETTLNFINLTKAFHRITEIYPGTEYRVATMGANLSAIDYWAENMPDPFQLVPSLHASLPKSRKKVIPGSSNIHKFIDAIVRFHSLRPKSHVLIKYIMIRGVNDSTHDLNALRKLLDPVRSFACLQFCVMNKTPFSQENRISGANEDIIINWMQRLQPLFTKNMLSLHFIDANEIACGQTTLRFLESYKTNH